MKGDFSRQTANPAKHYIGVLMQQGRVQVDADWNEQQAINRHLAVTEARDVIGPSGVPLDAGGFKIDLTPDGSDLTISSGRIYVDGILCELESTAIPIISFQGNQSAQVAPIWVVDDREFQVGQWVELSAAVQSIQVTKEVQITRVAKVTNANPEYLELTFNTTISEFQNADMQTAQIRRIATYITQPDYPNPTPIAQSQLILDPGTYVALVYLDVWQRHLTALDDPHIREAALGGPDTTTRLQTVWQVKVKPVSTSDIKALLDEFQLYSELVQIYQLLHDENPGDPFIAELLLLFQQAVETLTKDVYASLDAKNCSSQIPEWDEIIKSSTGTLIAQTQPVEVTDDPCLLPPSAGYQLLENQLYRVEVHYGSDMAGGPTFKWSRNNGWVAVKIDKISGSNILVDTLGPDDILGFINVDGNLGWAEIVDDWTELSGQPGQLVQITNVQPATNTITVDATLTPIDASRNPKLRRWDQTGVSATSNGIAITNGPQDLEGGLQVQFSQGKYTTGNYWLIPARTATVGAGTGTIEWPQDADSNPVPQPPLGIQHHYCRLGFLRKDPFNKVLSVPPLDCRILFPSLAPPAMHVLNTNWQNDDFFTSDRLFGEGLQVTLDATPVAQPGSKATLVVTPMIVTLEMPMTVLFAIPTDTNSLFALDLHLAINGALSTGSNFINWSWQGIDQPTLDQALYAAVNALGRPLYMRVTVKGRALWSDSGGQRIYLDGQAFGRSESTDLRSDKMSPRTALTVPSGSGARASDFESWFYLVPPVLQITRLNFVSTIKTPGQPVNSSAGVICLPPIRSSVQFKFGEQVNAIQITFNRPVNTNFVQQQTVYVQKSPDSSSSSAPAAAKTPLEVARATIEAARATPEAAKLPLEALRISPEVINALRGPAAAELSAIGVSVGGGLVKVPGSVSLNQDSTVATFTIDPNDQQFNRGFLQGSYTLIVSDTDAPASATIEGNDVMLDGDYDFLPGGVFQQPFAVLPDVVLSGSIISSIASGGIFRVA